MWPPHSGYHGTSTLFFNKENRFFEGWYLRIVTQSQGSLALIFHIFDPYSLASNRKGIGCQVITPGGTFRQESDHVADFRAAPHKLDIRNVFPPPKSSNSNARQSLSIECQDFIRVTTEKASGKLSCHEAVVKYEFGIEPQVGWGSKDEQQYSVTGFLAAFQSLNPTIKY
jgi:hypothetical protein